MQPPKYFERSFCEVTGSMSDQESGFFAGKYGRDRQDEANFDKHSTTPTKKSKNLP